jgi:CubicO group peptidase (beta-lactamase class C family)
LIKKVITISIIGTIFISSAITGMCEFEINSEFKIQERKDTYNEDFINFTIELSLLLGRIPSVSACIIKNNSIVWYGGYGHYNKHFPIIKRKKPDADTLYCCGSISKSFAATAILQLYEEGKFDLDDNINDYLDFEVRNPHYKDMNITFRMLLAHQSSLKENINLARWFLVSLYLLIEDEYPYPLIKDIFNPDRKIIEHFIWGNYAPGQETNYSNIGYILIEHLIEIFSNKSFNEYCKENIFERLGMNNSSFTINDLDIEKVAIPTTDILGFYLGYPNIDGPKAPGGLRTTVDDLSKYLIAHMNNGSYNGVSILSNKTIAEMHKPQYPGLGKRYGLGWFIWDDILGQKLEGHTGGVPGSMAFMFMNNTSDKGMILFVNRYLYTKIDPISIKYFDIVFEYIFEKFVNI